MGQLPFRENLEQFNNPEEVRRNLLEGKYRPPFDGIAQGYLDSVDRAASAKAEALRVAHDEAMLACAQEANRIASEAKESAKVAALAATAAASLASDANDIAHPNLRITKKSMVIAAIAAITAIIAAYAAIKGIK